MFLYFYIFCVFYIFNIFSTNANFVLNKKIKIHYLNGTSEYIENTNLIKFNGIGGIYNIFVDKNSGLIYKESLYNDHQYYAYQYIMNTYPDLYEKYLPTLIGIANVYTYDNITFAINKKHNNDYFYNGNYLIFEDFTKLYKNPHILSIKSSPKTTQTNSYNLNYYDIIGMTNTNISIDKSYNSTTNNIELLKTYFNINNITIQKINLINKFIDLLTTFSKDIQNIPLMFAQSSIVFLYDKYDYSSAKIIYLDFDRISFGNDKLINIRKHSINIIINDLKSIINNYQHFYLIRHGERIDYSDPDWIYNNNNFYDPPLSKSGIDQSIETAEYIINQPINFSCIVSSPFQRAIYMATIIKIYYDLPLIIDYGFGEFIKKNKSKNIPILHYNNSYYYNQNLIHYESLFNELKLESYDDVLNRTKYNLHNILKYCQNPLIISHRSTITILLDSLNISYNKNKELDYASISYGIYDKNNNNIKLLTYNQIEHLKTFIKSPITNPHYGKVINNFIY
jgi:broad specificity phosphatase PhoE